MKICNLPSSFPKITFCNNETCFSCNYMLLFRKHLSHRKTFDIDNLHNKYD